MDLFKSDYTSIIQEYDYTSKAIMNMNRMINSEMFEEMDAEAIFDYLLHEMETVSFKDYLKRYIYEKTKMTMPYSEVTDDIYMKIIMDSFETQNCPHSMTPTTTRWRTTVKRWLKVEHVTRLTVFLLGFGLMMTEQEVSTFLTKVLKEEDFNFYSVEEVVYWYCFHNKLSYSYAKMYLDYASGISQPIEINPNRWRSMQDYPKVYLGTEDNLKIYLSYLVQSQDEIVHKNRRYEVFEKLYARAKETVANSYWDDWDKLDDHQVKSERVTPGDIEKIIYSGVPFNAKGNMEKMSLSLLSEHFDHYRLTRQRILKIQAQKLDVLRYDLITLLFLIYALETEPENPEKRVIHFIKEIDELLAQAGMFGIYPVNPYEAFILMCLTTEYPLDVYEEIWKKSYKM